LEGDTLTHVGESWELSGVPGSESIVADGDHAGMTLTELVGTLGADLVGKECHERYGTTFPLLIKFIDARDQLSVQVHPNDEQARASGKKFGKTEMWYVMKSELDATLRCGLRRSITPGQYARMVADDTITDALAEYHVGEGDCFFIPAGRIHSIGAGCFLAEIQQTSDVTYRIYDFKRRDKNGNLRQLHTEEAARCIDYRVQDDYRVHYKPRTDEGIALVSCPYFSTKVYDLTMPMTINLDSLDSFVVLIALSGEAMLGDDAGCQTTLVAGQTILVPATTRGLRLDGRIKLLMTHA